MVRWLVPARRTAILALPVLVSVALLAVVWLTVKPGGASRRATDRFEPLTGDVVAVLALEPPRIVLLDAETLDIRSQVGLRSTAIDIDAGGGVLVTAQCGGPGPASDTAVGVVDPADGTIAYVETGALDPEMVAAWSAPLGSHWLVVHGEVHAGASAGAIVDSGDYTSRQATLPAGITSVEALGGQVWATGLTAGEGDELQESLYAGSDAGWERVAMLDAPVFALADGGDGVVLVQEGAGGRVRLSVRDAGGLVIREAEVGSLDLGIGAVCTVRPGLIAVADSDWRDPSRAGSRVLLLDTDALEAHSVVGQLDGPVSMCSDGDSLFIGCQTSGEVVRVDVESGQVVARSSADRTLVDLVDMTVWRAGM